MLPRFFRLMAMLSKVAAFERKAMAAITARMVALMAARLVRVGASPNISSGDIPDADDGDDDISAGAPVSFRPTSSFTS